MAITNARSRPGNLPARPQHTVVKGWRPYLAQPKLNESLRTTKLDSQDRSSPSRAHQLSNAIVHNRHAAASFKPIFSESVGEPSKREQYRPQADDKSSVTSNSTETSRKRNLCHYASCRQPENPILGSLVKCMRTGCRRSFHDRCGNTSTPVAARTAKENFVCSRCLRDGYSKIGTNWPTKPSSVSGHYTSKDQASAESTRAGDASRVINGTVATGPRPGAQAISVGRAIDFSSDDGDSGRNTGSYEAVGAKRRKIDTSDERRSLEHEIAPATAISPERSQVLALSEGPRLFDIIDNASIAPSDEAVEVPEKVTQDETGPTAEIKEVPEKDSVHVPAAELEDLPEKESVHVSVDEAPQRPSPRERKGLEEPVPSPKSGVNRVTAAPTSELKTSDLQHTTTFDLPSGTSCVHEDSQIHPDRRSMVQLPPPEVPPNQPLSMKRRADIELDLNKKTIADCASPNIIYLETARRYKGITCRHWLIKNAECKSEESPEKCHFAHKETDYVQPMNRHSWRAKAFTCFDFSQGRSCSQVSCHFSHLDTGLYVTSAGHASMKHVTCAHWKARGSCTRGESCNWAHKDTGVYVSMDNKLINPQEIARYAAMRQESREGHQKPQPNKPILQNSESVIAENRVTNSPGPSVGQPSLRSALPTPEYSPISATRSVFSPIHGVDTPFSPQPSINSDAMQSIADATQAKPDATPETGQTPVQAQPSQVPSATKPNPQKRGPAWANGDPRGMTKMMRMAKGAVTNDIASLTSSSQAQTVDSTKEGTKSVITGLRTCAGTDCKTTVMGSIYCSLCLRFKYAGQLAIEGGHPEGTGTNARKELAQQQSSLDVAMNETAAHIIEESESSPAKRRDSGSTLRLAAKRIEPPLLMVGHLDDVSDVPGQAVPGPVHAAGSTKHQGAEIPSEESDARLGVRGDKQQDGPSSQPATSPSTDEQATALSNSTAATSVEEIVPSLPPTVKSVFESGTTNPLSSLSATQKRFKRCEKCQSTHNRCLHGASGDLDPQRCQDYMLSIRGREADHGRSIADIEAIRRAAAAASVVTKGGQNAQDSESDDDRPLIDRRRRQLIATTGEQPTQQPSGLVSKTFSQDMSDSDDDRPLAQRRVSGRQKDDSHLRLAVIPRTQAKNVREQQLSGPDASASSAKIDSNRIQALDESRAPEKQHADALRHPVVPEHAFVSKDNLNPFSQAKPPARNEPQPTLSAPYKSSVPLSAAGSLPQYQARADSASGAVQLDLDSVIAKLKEKGITFEDDSDEEMEEATNPTTDKHLLSWQGLQRSNNLFDIAPMLRREPLVRYQSKTKNLKTKSGEVLAQQMQKNVAQFGNDHPHRIHRREGQLRTAKTAPRRDLTNLNWKDYNPNKDESVVISIEEYMGLPVDPIFVRENGGRDLPADPAVDDGELAFKDGKREREQLVNGANRRTRGLGVDTRWYFAR